MRRLVPLLLMIVLACAHKASDGPTVLKNETVMEDKAEVVYELAYAAKGSRKVELVLKMRVNGLVETSKLVAEVYVQGGFNVDDSGTRWDGFLPPRQPQTFRVGLVIPEGFDTATATISLTRSHDSFSLMKETLTFTVDDKGVVKLQG
jgi:hypothetical protein